MIDKEKFKWMKDYCSSIGCILDFNSVLNNVPCIGILFNDYHPEYKWCNGKYSQIDNNGLVWVPSFSYCDSAIVAVVGRDEVAKNQLYQWLYWFKKNDFKIQIVKNGNSCKMDEILKINYKGVMVKNAKS